MEQEDRARLQKNRSVLVEDLDVKEVLDELISEDILNDDIAEGINAEKTRKDRARKLLEILPRKGSRAYSVFRTALAKKYDFLVEQLDNTDVGKVNTPTRTATEHQEGACAGGACNLSTGLGNLTVESKAQRGATSGSEKQPPKNIKVTQQTFLEISKKGKVLQKWRIFGHALGLSEADIENTWYRNQHNLQCLVFELLRVWQQQQGSKPSGSQLLRALIDVDCDDLADALLKSE